MKTPNTIESELNDIRVKLYEETKDMTIQERVDYFKSITDPICKERGWHAIDEPIDMSKKEAIAL
jgi:hypothetical protein